MKRGRQPDPSSLNGRIRAFYECNPDEYMTYSDLSKKFGVSLDQVRRSVNYLQNRGTPLQCVKVIRLRADE